MTQENEEASRRRDLHTAHDAVGKGALCNHYGRGLRFTRAHLTDATAEPGPGMHARDRAGAPSLAARANRLALREAAIVRAGVDPRYTWTYLPPYLTDKFLLANCTCNL